MNPKYLGKILGLVVLLVIASVVDGTAEDITAKIVSVKGTVKLVRGTQESQLSTKSVLRPGETIKTGANSEAIISWGDGNVVKIYPLSVFVFKQADKKGDSEKTSLDVTQGNVFAKVKKLKNKSSSFEIKTPVAIAGVRGSEIFVGTAEKETNFSVLSGAFQIKGDGFDVALTPGLQLDLNAETVAGGIAAPSEIPVEKMEKLRAEAEVVLKEVASQETSSSSSGSSGSDSVLDADTGVDAASGMNDVLQDAMDESISNDTITNQAMDNAIQELEAGMGGLIITIE